MSGASDKVESQELFTKCPAFDWLIRESSDRAAKKEHRPAGIFDDDFELTAISESGDAIGIEHEIEEPCTLGASLFE